MEDNLINTKDLILYTVELAEYELLEADYAHPKLWLNRGFSDPYKYFLNNRNPIPCRINQVRIDPEAAKYLLRVAVLRDSMEIIGTALFALTLISYISIHKIRPHFLLIYLYGKTVINKV